MYVIDDLCLNDFQDVYIPSSRELYERLGYSNPRAVGNVPSDGSFADPVNLQDNVDKLTAISLGAKIIRSENQDAQRRANEEREAVTNKQVSDLPDSQ